MDKSGKISIYVVFVILVIVGITGYAFVTADESNTEPQELKKFESQEEFNEFIEKDSIRYTSQPTVEFRASADSTEGDTSSNNGYSTKQTNIQVRGIDEPDRVKLTREAAYYSPPRFYRISLPAVGRDISSIKPPQQTTKVIDTENTSAPEIVANIDMDGEMLRSGNSLVIYNNRKIASYDVSDKETPTEKWSYELSDSSSVSTSRMRDGKAYFVIENYKPDCPIQHLKNTSSTECDDVYYPKELDQANSVYSVLTISPDDGNVKSEASFVGSDQGTTVYMTEKSLYVSYEKSDFNIGEFVDSELPKLDLDNKVESALAQRLTEENVSSEYQYRRIVRNVVDSRDDREELKDILISSFEDYLDENNRQIHRTILVKFEVSSDGVDPIATGSVPGLPLNQYSFDEHQGDVRISTTVQPNDNEDSVNHLYVLDDSLDVKGSIQGMAEGQRVYAVRFLEEKAYIITYRQIDPLHVIDLSNHQDPKEVGVLEITGFSDYLHQVSEDRIVGIGESQNRNAKITLFDVADSSNPEVSDSIILENERSTEVSNNYRSFLEDEDKNRMYIPASQGVHVIGYEGDGIEHIETIETPTMAERVRILGDDLYVFHTNGVMSVDRDSFETNGGVGFTN